MTRIDEIRARLSAATPGKWEAQAVGPHRFITGPENGYGAPDVLDGDACVNVEANTDLIAHAPEDLTHLLDLVTAQQERIKALEELLSRALDVIPCGESILQDDILATLEGANR